MQGQRGGGGQPEQNKPSLGEEMRAARIVKGGLLFGMVAFTCVAALVAPIGGPTAGDSMGSPLLTVLGLMVVANIPAQIVVRRRFVEELRRQAPRLRQKGDSIAEVMGLYRGYMITSSGLVEGTGLFANVIFMLTASKVALGVIAAAAVWFLVTFPTLDSVERMVEEAIASA